MSLCINPQCQKPNNSSTLLFCQNCGSELLLDGRYRAIRQMGGGGFGKTYEVLDRHSQSQVLKVLIRNYPKYVELFQQEAHILSTLNHYGIPKVEEDGYFTYYPRDEEEPLHCLVMEKIEGLNLQEYIQQRDNRPISQKRVLQWLAELAAILEQVHNHNFFHRDIKPANIMLRVDGRLVLIDFGTVRQVTDTYLQKQAAGLITGVFSTGYTPLEQIKGQAVQQSDFYALGGTMIFLLTAQNPSDFYDPDTDKIYWRQAVQNILPRFATLIDHLMATLPSQRPQTARDILTEIASIDPHLPAVQTYFSFAPQTNIPLIPNTNLGGENFSVTPVSAQIQPSLTQDFINLCRRELAECIGPIATVICRRTLNQNPTISTLEFVEALAQKIPNPDQAREFRQRVINP